MNKVGFRNSHIVGYTFSKALYGVTWDEMDSEIEE